MCTDTARNVVVLFGGLGAGRDTWEWNGTTWTKMAPTVSPPELGWAKMTYDSARKVCVLFGGLTPTAVGDTWEWNGSNWRLRGSGGPSPRHGHAQCYDSARRVTVLFGGADDYPRSLTDTWEYDGTTWKRVATTGPVGRLYAEMTYDATRARCVLFGGYRASAQQDTWEWNGVSWIETKLAIQPQARWGFAMSYVPGRGAVLFGGETGDPSNPRLLRDTWLYNGTWTEVRATNSPSARRLTAMAFDPTNGQTLLFGGSTGGHESHSLKLDPSAPAKYEPYGTGCAGTGGTPTLGSIDGRLPFINETMGIQLTNIPWASNPQLIFGLSNAKWGGANLPMDWSFMGFNGCSLLASLDLHVSMVNAGNYAYFFLAIPNLSILVGSSFYNQAFVPDSGANPAGGTLSNGVAATIGRR
ncbi:MAG: hypothetical protein H6837_11430 [Planctomycetes bacterium]|nr:hypothetical protein [Planctomycetota bacterium]